MDSRSRKKSKGQKLFSNGVVVLVCLILAAQAVFFGKYLIDSRRTMREGQRQEEIQGSQDNTPGQEGPSARDGSSAQAPPSRSGSQGPSGGADRHGPSITGQGESSSRRTGGTSYDGQPGRTSSATAATRAGSSSDNHPSEQTFSPVPATTSTPAADSSPHTDSPRDSRTGYNPTLSYPHDGWSWDRVELNSADSAALDALPGIGPYYARQIIAYRERIGFFADISQLLDIRGMDTARLRRLADRLYIAPESLRRSPPLYRSLRRQGHRPPPPHPTRNGIHLPGHPRQPHPPAGTGPPARAVLPGDKSTVSRSAPHFYKHLIIRDESTCLVLFVTSAMPAKHTHLR